MPGEADPQHWRDLAKEARAKADQMNARSKRRMFGLADFYVGLAMRIEAPPAGASPHMRRRKSDPNKRT